MLAGIAATRPIRNIGANCHTQGAFRLVASLALTLDMSIAPTALDVAYDAVITAKDAQTTANHLADFARAIASLQQGFYPEAFESGHHDPSEELALIGKDTGRLASALRSQLPAIVRNHLTCTKCNSQRTSTDFKEVFAIFVNDRDASSLSLRSAPSLVENVFCSVCSGSHPHAHVTEFVPKGSTLFVILPKTNSVGQKTTDKFVPPLELHSDSATYCLAGHATHSGDSARAGHYITTVFDANARIVRCNDTVITEVKCFSPAQAAIVMYRSDRRILSSEGLAERSVKKTVVPSPPFPRPFKMFCNRDRCPKPQCGDIVSTWDSELGCVVTVRILEMIEVQQQTGCTFHVVSCDNDTMHWLTRTIRVTSGPCLS